MQNVLAKALPTDRIRQPTAFVETRTGAYYGKLGYLAGLGRSSEQIAEAMGDGIHPSYVRTLLKRWGIPQRREFCRVPLTILERVTLAWRAEKAGMTVEDWLADVVRKAIAGS